MNLSRQKLYFTTGAIASFALVIALSRQSEPSPAAACARILIPHASSQVSTEKVTVPPTLREKIAAIKSYYRLEQIRSELAIEQRRYGAHYWDTELGAKQRLELHAERLVRLRELTSEMAGVLKGMNAAATEAVDDLTPLYGPESAGPNLTFLSPASREKFEFLIEDLARNGTVDATTLLEKARTVLNETEFIQYTQWNAPRAALLRNQLVGYSATESEFNAIAQWSDFVSPIPVAPEERSAALIALEKQLGTARFAELMHLRTPEMQTATHDLHRLGLPLEYAKWLSDFRAQGTKTFQAVWTDPAIPPAAKAARVEQLQEAYRTSLLANLSPTGATFDETELLP